VFVFTGWTQGGCWPWSANRGLYGPASEAESEKGMASARFIDSPPTSFSPTSIPLKSKNSAIVERCTLWCKLKVIVGCCGFC
jgi:hypothetical protein